MTSLLAAALKYAGEHLPVFPCVPALQTARSARRIVQNESTG
jgi:hypothetical protein